MSSMWTVAIHTTVSRRANADPPTYLRGVFAAKLVPTAPHSILVTWRPAPPQISSLAAGVKSDLESFRSLASPEHVLILANAATQSNAMRAWAEAEAGGALEWEGTLLESVDRPAGDALVYGRYAAKVSVPVPVQP